MKLVLSLLAQHLQLAPQVTPQQLSAALVQLGHEVEAIHTSGHTPQAVHQQPQLVVGHVLSREQHPNADKLGVCLVDVGEAAPRQIVCGAPNARAGLTVAVALPGAVLPGDVHIKAAAIRGTESNGMLCSLRELGFGEEHNGIWELTTTAPAGTPLIQILPTELGTPETILEVSLTPNRGDCFSHRGLALDLAALGLGTILPLPALTPGSATTHVTASTLTANCPQLNLLELTGLTNASSPPAVQSQLIAAGLRPINAVVDATNYTMLSLGQPLHAYDAALLPSPNLTADVAQSGEVFAGLNETKLTLHPADTVIRSGAQLVGLAGILGGQGTAVSASTTHVVLEAAMFDPVAISLTGQRHQLHTDARQRFERGIDPALTQTALRFCAHLVQQWCQQTPLTISQLVSAGPGVPSPAPIAYQPEFFERYIGLAVPAAQQQDILTSLGFQVTTGSPWHVVPPTRRTYMSTPEDLTEEILRVVGYENVPATLPVSQGSQPQVNSSAIVLDRTARKAAAAAGFLEVMTYSFIGQTQAELFANGAQLITLANPLAQTEMTTLRPSLLPGVLGALAKNLANHEPTPRLAEVGKVYPASAEALMAAGVLAGVAPRHWQHAPSKPTVYSAKAAAQQVLATLGAPVASGSVASTAPAYYHPGRSGTLSVGPFMLAHFGELHPAVRSQLNLPANLPLAVFELYLEPLLKLTSKPRPWVATPFPPVHRDLAFLLPQTVTAQQVVQVLTSSTRKVLNDIQLTTAVFDHYVGERIPAGQQSLALSLTLQAPGRTLTEADVQPILTAATQAVAQQLQGQLRA